MILQSRGKDQEVKIGQYKVRINIKRYIRAKLLKAKGKKNLKSSRIRSDTMFRRTTIRMAAGFSTEITESKRQYKIKNKIMNC